MKAEEIRERIAAAKAVWPQRAVDVPQWGVSVLVRGMSGEQRCAYHSYISKGEGEAERFRLKLLSLTVCDESGEPIYPDNNGKEFGELPGAQLDRLTDAALELSFKTEDEQEELEKNLEAEGTNGCG